MIINYIESSIKSIIISQLIKEFGLIKVIPVLAFL